MSITLQLNAAYAILAAIVAVTFVVCSFRFLMRREENRRLQLLQPEPVLWPQRPETERDTGLYRDAQTKTVKLPDAS